MLAIPGFSFQLLVCLSVAAIAVWPALDLVVLPGCSALPSWYVPQVLVSLHFASRTRFERLQLWLERLRLRRRLDPKNLIGILFI